MLEWSRGEILPPSTCRYSCSPTRSEIRFRGRAARLYLRHGWDRGWPGASQGGRRREGRRDLGGRKHRAAIPEGGSVGRDADPPRPSPPWWWSSPLRGPRPGTDRPGKNADDRDPKGNPSSIHHHEAREVTSLFFPWFRSAIVLRQ